VTFIINDDTRMLRDTAARYFAGAGTIPALRRGRAERDFVGLARGAWDGIVDLGLAGILVPEEFGGTGVGYASSIHIAEMMGRSLATGPFISTAIMAATAIRDGDNAALKASLLPLIAGGTVFAIAAEEAARHNPSEVKSVARRADANAYKVSGHKIAVIDGNIAAKLIVAARFEDRPDSLGLFVVDSGAPGVSIRSGLGVDSHPCVTIALDGVAARTSDLLCAPERSGALLERVYDAGRLHLAAEMLGLAQEAFDRTIEYLKTRVQFGRKIGEFQALQHRTAVLFGELEIARSVVLETAAQGTKARFAEYVSLAKAKVSEVAKRVAGEAVQLHGGIGVTDDFDIGLYLKRARVAAEQLGDWAFHAERYAKIQGL
jgi:alkylation response protein AidB-like acyl-CoA dehydrogenase